MVIGDDLGLFLERCERLCGEHGSPLPRIVRAKSAAATIVFAANDVGERGRG